MSDRSLPPEEALALCASLSSVSARGDCGVTVAVRASLSAGDEPERWCKQVEEGTWRAECFFQAAERWRRKGNRGHAAQLCQHSGPFADDCAQHLWQTALREMLAGAGAMAFDAALPQAEALYAQWAPLVGEWSDLEQRFWLRFYQNGFVQEETLRPQRCDGLPAEHAERCLEAATAQYQRRVKEWVVRPGGRESFCGLSPPSIAAASDIAPHFAASPTPTLEAALAYEFDWICVQGRQDPAPPFGWEG